MADQLLEFNQSVPVDTIIRWKDMGDGTFALVAGAVSLLDMEGSLVVAKADEITGGLEGISTVHHEVHEGETWQAGVSNLALADDATLSMILMGGGTKELHTVLTAACGGDAEIGLTKNVIVTVAGGALAEVNLKDSSTKTNDGIAQSAPTAVGGTAYPTRFLPGGTGGNAAGGTIRTDTEFIVGKNSNLFVELTNRSGNAKVASITMQWYEEDPV